MLSTQWPRAMLGADPIIFSREGRLRMLRDNSVTTIINLMCRLAFQPQTCAVWEASTSTWGLE